jgi:hypothetical protein
VGTGVAGAPVTTGIWPFESSWKLLSEPLQTDQDDSEPFSFRWLGMTAPICAVSPMPPANAGTAGDAKKFALRLKSRMNWSCEASVARSVAWKYWPPERSAMHCRVALKVGSCVSATTYTGTPLVLTFGSSDAASARRPAALSGSRTSPRSPAGPFPLIVPPEQIAASAPHSSLPSVMYTTMYLRQSIDGSGAG